MASSLQVMAMGQSSHSWTMRWVAVDTEGMVEAPKVCQQFQHEVALGYLKRDRGTENLLEVAMQNRKAGEDDFCTVVNVRIVDFELQHPRARD